MPFFVWDFVVRNFLYINILIVTKETKTPLLRQSASRYVEFSIFRTCAYCKNTCKICKMSYFIVRPIIIIFFFIRLVVKIPRVKNKS